MCVTSLFWFNLFRQIRQKILTQENTQKHNKEVNKVYVKKTSLVVINCITFVHMLHILFPKLCMGWVYVFRTQTV